VLVDSPFSFKSQEREREIDRERERERERESSRKFLITPAPKTNNNRLQQQTSLCVVNAHPCLFALLVCVHLHFLIKKEEGKDDT
jgi:hypothetical protein